MCSWVRLSVASIASPPVLTLAPRRSQIVWSTEGTPVGSRYCSARHASSLGPSFSFLCTGLAWVRRTAFFFSTSSATVEVSSPTTCAGMRRLAAARFHHHRQDGFGPCPGPVDLINFEHKVLRSTDTFGAQEGAGHRLVASHPFNETPVKA